MKMALALGVAAFLIWLAFSPAPGPLARFTQSGSPGTAALVAPPEIRKFDLHIEMTRFGGQGIAEGAFYDVPPTVTTSPERLSDNDAKRTKIGRIYVTGLPGGLTNNPFWIGWLSPNGTRTYTDPRGETHTVPAYLVVPAPPTVEYKPKPGAWMYEGGTSLDQRTRAK